MSDSVEQQAPTLDISLAGVHVDFPDGWWDDPSNDLLSPRGRLMIDERIDGLALIIAGTLRKLLRERRPASSGLVDTTGRPLASGIPQPHPAAAAEDSFLGVMAHQVCDEISKETERVTRQGLVFGEDTSPERFRPAPGR